jgi:phosphopantetheine adenylyltransferase
MSRFSSHDQSDLFKIISIPIDGPLPPLLEPAMSSTLLLLPPIPYPPTYASLKAAYHAPLLTLLRSLAHAHSLDTERAILDIALPIPLLYKYRDAPRAALFDFTQKALAGIYKLITIISVREGLNVEGDEGVDVRVLLVAWPRDGKVGEDEFGSGVVGIAQLVTSWRWKDVVGVESEEGESILRAFLAFADKRKQIEVTKIRGGIVHVEGGQEESFGKDGFGDVEKHFSVINGGTFDHLHIGHKLLLSMTAFVLDPLPAGTESSRRYITIGITAEDQLKNKKYVEFLESWNERQEAIHQFLRGVMCFDEPGKEFEETIERNNPGPNGHVVEVQLSGDISILYTEIWDPFGPTITEEGISALILSEETRKGGQAVNDKRREFGFKSLDVFEVDVLDAGEEEEQEQPDSVEKQFLSKLSSTEIRKARSERVGGKSKV